MATELPEPSVQVDLAGIVQAVPDYQGQREVKARRHMILVNEHMEALNDLMDLGFAHRATLMEIGFLEPMQKIVTKMLDSSIESINTHNEDAANMLGAVKIIGRKVDKAVNEYERGK